MQNWLVFAFVSIMWLIQQDDLHAMRRSFRDKIKSSVLSQSSEKADRGQSNKNNVKDINERDYDGKTFLHHAAARDKVDLARKLLEAGARMDIPDNDNRSAGYYVTSLAMFNVFLEHNWYYDRQKERSTGV